MAKARLELEDCRVYSYEYIQYKIFVDGKLFITGWKRVEHSPYKVHFDHRNGTVKIEDTTQSVRHMVMNEIKNSYYWLEFE